MDQATLEVVRTIANVFGWVVGIAILGGVAKYCTKEYFLHQKRVLDIETAKEKKAEELAHALQRPRQ